MPTAPPTDLLCVLFEQAKLEALVQLQLADVPGLVEVLSGGVQLVQQLADPWDQALGVGVAHPTAATAAATAATGAAVPIGEGLAALDALEQSVDGFNMWVNVKADLQMSVHCPAELHFCVTCHCLILNYQIKILHSLYFASAFPSISALLPLPLCIQLLYRSFNDLLLQRGMLFDHPPGSFQVLRKVFP